MLSVCIYVCMYVRCVRVLRQMGGHLPPALTTLNTNTVLLVSARKGGPYVKTAWPSLAKTPQSVWETIKRLLFSAITLYSQEEMARPQKPIGPCFMMKYLSPYFETKVAISINMSYTAKKVKGMKISFSWSNFDWITWTYIQKKRQKKANKVSLMLLIVHTVDWSFRKGWGR